MQTAVKSELMSVAEYLATEGVSDVRHEYLCGTMFEMQPESKLHNQIVVNLICELRSGLKGSAHNLYAMNLWVNSELRNDESFYYPDIVVTCDKRDTHERSIRHPKLIIEVLSESTERVDKREKFFAYTSIASLEEYVLVEQDVKDVTVFCRGNSWKGEKFSGKKSAAVLKSLKLKLPLAAIYEGV